jgi:hypothetical protein
MRFPRPSPFRVPLVTLNVVYLAVVNLADGPLLTLTSTSTAAGPRLDPFSFTGNDDPFLRA